MSSNEVESPSNTPSAASSQSEKEAIETWVQSLWCTIRRAGEHLGEHGKCEPVEKAWYVQMQLQWKPDIPSQAALRVLMKEFGKEHGWKVSKIVFHRRYVDFLASRA